MIECQGGEITIGQQAKLLGLDRSGVYYVPAIVSAEELQIKHAIDRLYTELPFYGSRKIADELGINRKAAQRHMREIGICGISPGPNTSKRAAKAGLFPYLLRGLTATGPNHVWGIDITYIRMQQGWMYLVAVMDWFSRYVISWEVDNSLEETFVLTTVDRALKHASPVIWNSDQGSHFTSPQYVERLLEQGVNISMDGKGRALDNVFTERLWRSVKYEEVFLNEYVDGTHGRQRLDKYFKFYNHRRHHQALGYRTPAAVYFGQG